MALPIEPTTQDPGSNTVVSCSVSPPGPKQAISQPIAMVTRLSPLITTVQVLAVVVSQPRANLIGVPKPYGFVKVTRSWTVLPSSNVAGAPAASPAGQVEPSLRRTR